MQLHIHQLKLVDNVELIYFLFCIVILNGRNEHKHKPVSFYKMHDVKSKFFENLHSQISLLLVVHHINETQYAFISCVHHGQFTLHSLCCLGIFMLIG